MSFRTQIVARIVRVLKGDGSPSVTIGDFNPGNGWSPSGYDASLVLTPEGSETGDRYAAVQAGAIGTLNLGFGEFGGAYTPELAVTEGGGVTIWAEQGIEPSLWFSTYGPPEDLGAGTQHNTRVGSFGLDTHRIVNTSGKPLTVQPNAPVPLALVNGWLPYSSAYGTPQAELTIDRKLSLSGLVKHPTTSTTGLICVLPVALRPKVARAVLTLATNGAAYLHIATTGNVTVSVYIAGGSASYVSFDNITVAL